MKSKFNIIGRVLAASAFSLFLTGAFLQAQDADEKPKADKKIKKERSAKSEVAETQDADTDTAPAAFAGKKITSGAAFRNGVMRSGAHKGAGPVASPKIKWKCPTGGPVFSSPVHWNGTVYVGTQNNALLAIDAQTGKEKWRFETGAPVGSSACIANGVAWFTSTDGTLWGIETETGKEKLKIKNNAKGTRCSPAVAYGVVYVYADGVSGFDVETGKKVYSAKGSAGNEAAVAMNATLEIHPTKGAGVNAHDVSTGETVAFWTGLSSSVNNAAIVDDIAYLSSTAYCNTDAKLPSVSAVDLKTIKNLWNERAEPHISDKQKAGIYGSPAVWNGRLYSGCDSGFLYAFNTSDGKPSWSFKTGGQVRSSPSVGAAGNAVFFTARDGNLYALNAETGKELWKLDIGHKPEGLDRESCLDSGAWIHDKTLFVGSADGNVYAIE